MDDRLDAVEKAIRHHEQPVVSASEVAEALDEDVPRRDVLEDLRVLERTGEVGRNKVGARAVAWWHTDRVLPAPPKDPADHPDQAGLEDAATSPPTPRPTDEPRDDEEAAHAPLTSVDDVEEYLTDHPPNTAHGKRAVLEAARYLRDHGPAPTSEVSEAVFEIDEIGEHYGSPRTMWNAFDRYLEDIPGFEKPGYGEWDFNSN